MEREYLLKIIERNFFVLSKEEIADRINKSSLTISDTNKVCLKDQYPQLNEIENRVFLNPAFCDNVADLTHRISEISNKSSVNVLKLEKIADDTLLLISIYYHYQAVLYDNIMLRFLRLVMKEKILLA